MKVCKVCKITKELTQFSSCGNYNGKIYYRNECKDCNKVLFSEANKEACRKYRQTENGKEKRKAYKKTEKAKEYNREYDKIRGLKPERKHQQYLNLKRKLEEDPLFRLKHNMRNRVRNAFKAKYWKKNNSISQHIGCSLEELKSYIEKLFEPGMNWENYGHGIGKWTLDHSIPLSSAKTEEEMYKLCHYTNLKPMWYLDNIKKSNKVA